MIWIADVGLVALVALMRSGRRLSGDLLHLEVELGRLAIEEEG